MWFRVQIKIIYFNQRKEDKQQIFLVITRLKEDFFNPQIFLEIIQRKEHKIWVLVKIIYYNQRKEDKHLIFLVIIRLQED